MKKNILTIGLLAISLSVQAQTELMHFDDTAKMYVSKNTLLYNGGGLKLVGSSQLENHGNVMIVGSSTDIFTTTTTAGVDKTEANAGGNFVNKLNEPTAFAVRNKTDDTATTSVDESQVYTYGQLYISGLTQSNIKGYVDQEYAQVNHGDYQQIGLPFYGKTFSTLSTELGKTFTNTRYSKNEILVWNNTNVVFDNLTGGVASTITNPKNYYILGALGLNFNVVKTLKGRPVAEETVANQVMQNAGSAISFGSGGNAINQYNEKYNTYLQDGFHIAAGGTAWQGDFGKYIYQYSNPFMTNLDLSGIALTTGIDPDGDSNYLNSFQGVRLEVSGVAYNAASGGGSTSYKYVSRNTTTGRLDVGDVEYLNVRPLGTFVLKFTNDGTSNAAQHTLNFQNLRRFNYLTRAESTSYSVTAAKNGTGNTTKQLTVIALNSAGAEIGRTYYVVSADATSGNSLNAKMQVNAFSSNPIGTFEEDPIAGGYDYNYTGSYWLYINEAHEGNFLGKNIKLVKYSNDVASYRFEVKENGVYIPNNTHALSSGTGFYFKPSNGTVQEAKQGNIIPVTQQVYDLYYGMPNSAVLGTNETKTPSRTMVIFVPEINDYIVRFDPNWKKADITVFDMSGKLVLSEKDVKADKDFVIDLDDSLKNGYIVNVVSETGDKVTTKILK